MRVEYAAKKKSAENVLNLNSLAIIIIIRNFVAQNMLRYGIIAWLYTQQNTCFMGLYYTESTMSME